MIKLLCIEGFYLNVQKHDNFSPLHINLKISTYFNKFFTYLFGIWINMKSIFCNVDFYKMHGKYVLTNKIYNIFPMVLSKIQWSLFHSII